MELGPSEEAFAIEEEKGREATVPTSLKWLPNGAVKRVEMAGGEAGKEVVEEWTGG